MKKSNQALIIRAYLSAIMPLVLPRLSDPNAKAGARVFLLGVVDMLRQSDDLDWDSFILIYEQTLSDIRLLPPMKVGEFIDRVEQEISTNGSVERLMKYGAQSITMYIAEHDANAPTDFLSAVAFAEKNAADFSGLA